MTYVEWVDWMLERHRGDFEPRGRGSDYNLHWLLVIATPDELARLEE